MVPLRAAGSHGQPQIYKPPLRDPGVLVMGLDKSHATGDVQLSHTIARTGTGKKLSTVAQGQRGLREYSYFMDITGSLFHVGLPFSIALCFSEWSSTRYWDYCPDCYRADRQAKYSLDTETILGLVHLMFFDYFCK